MNPVYAIAKKAPVIVGGRSYRSYWYGGNGFVLDAQEAALFQHKDRADEAMNFFRMNDCEVVECPHTT